MSQPKPALRAEGALKTPAWWTPEDQADRNAATLGCRHALHNCAESRKRCPLNVQVCRTCAMWASEDGHAGTCERGEARPTRRIDFCPGWRGRVVV
jgi:hypothetical protein